MVIGQPAPGIKCCNKNGCTDRSWPRPLIGSSAAHNRHGHWELAASWTKARGMKFRRTGGANS